MKGRERFTIFLFLSLCIFSLLAGVACASPNGYTVEPITPGMDTGTPLETVRVDFWDLPLDIMALALVMTVSDFFGVPLELFLIIRLYAYFGYRKVTRKFVLENETRNEIFRAIQSNPGIYFNSLERKTGIGHGTLRYHLFVLRTTGKITVLNAMGDTRYFENSGKFSEREMTVLKYIRNETDNRILSLVLKNPAMVRKDLKEKTGMSGPLVTWYMKRLSDDGIILVQKNGRFTRYAINPDAQAYLEKYLVSIKK